MVCYSNLSKNCPQFAVIHTIKALNIVNETEVSVFLEFPCFLHDLLNVGNLISGSSASSKPSWKHLEVLVQIMLKPTLKDFEQNLANM